MKSAILTPALVVAITCSMISPASAQFRNSNRQGQPSNKGYTTLDQTRWRNGTAGSQAPRTSAPRRPALSPPYSQQGHGKPSSKFRSQVEPSGKSASRAGGASSNVRRVDQAWAKYNQHVERQAKRTGGPARRAATPRPTAKPQVDFRTKFHGPAGSRALSPQLQQKMLRSNNEQLTRLRDMKNPTSTTKRTPLKPYAQGSRTKQLMSKFAEETGTHRSGTMSRPDSNPQNQKSRYTNRKTQRAPASSRQTASSARPKNSTAGRAARYSSSPTTRAARTAKTAKMAKTAGKIAKATGAGLVAGAVLKDTTGIDPIELGVDAVGDAINGTNNAQQTLNNVENSFNGSLTKQIVTDPAGAANRVKNDVEAAGRDISNAVKDPGKAIGSLFAP